MESYDYFIQQHTSNNNAKIILNRVRETVHSNLQQGCNEWYIPYIGFMESITMIENMIDEEEMEKSDTNKNKTFISNFEEQKSKPTHQNDQFQSSIAKEDNVDEKKRIKEVITSSAHFRRLCSTCNCRYVLNRISYSNKPHRTCTICIARKKKYYKKMKSYLLQNRI